MTKKQLFLIFAVIFGCIIITAWLDNVYGLTVAVLALLYFLGKINPPPANPAT